MSYKSLLLLGVAAFAVPASAGILSVTGDFTIFGSATADYEANGYNDAGEAPMHIWVEQTDIMLTSSVDLDTDLADSTKRYVVGGAGAGEIAFGAGSGPTLAKGRRVNVYYAYFDPEGSDSARGTVTFGEKILGIVAHTSELKNSDFLRVGGADYPANPAFSARGWENTEWGMVDAARTTFTWNAKASSPGDQFRIFTEAEVPEPGSFALLAAGIGALVLARRKR